MAHEKLSTLQNMFASMIIYGKIDFFSETAEGVNSWEQLFSLKSSPYFESDKILSFKSRPMVKKQNRFCLLMFLYCK